jgi:hypothetical protein
MIIKSVRMRLMDRQAACVGKERNAYKILLGKHEENKQLIRRRGNIKMDLKEIGLEFLNWIHPIQNIDCFWALLNIVMNLQIL